jgi:methylmalonyl-CoA/ethylmalonyl-CoA epimerase
MYELRCCACLLLALRSARDDNGLRLPHAVCHPLALMLDAQVDHVAVAVRSVGAAVPLFVDALGGEFLFAGENSSQGFRWAQFRFPHGGKIELVTPIAGDGFVQRFLDTRGEGVHHVTFKTPDIFRSVEHLRAKGVELMRVSTDHPTWKEAFIHPKDAHGVLIQIAQSAWSDEQAAQHHLSDHETDDHRHLGLADLIG